MRREEISEAVGNISPQFILEAETYSPKKRRLAIPFRGGLIAAAMLCLAVLLEIFPALHPADAFSVKAYALDLDDSGTVVLREEDLLEKSDYWGGYRDGENSYINMGFRYEGANLKSVTFTTEEGFFAEQRITPGMTEDTVTKIYIGPDHRLVVFGAEFKTLGSTVTLEGEEMEENLLLFWGVQATSTDDIPKNPTINATAVFQNGSTQTIRVNLDLSGVAVFGGKCNVDTQDGRPIAFHESQHYGNLSLEKCELVDEQTVTDTYEYTIDDYTISLKIPEKPLFAGDGVYRARRLRISGAFYLPVFQKDGGDCIARLYRVPKELEFSEENEEKATLQQAEVDEMTPNTAASSKEVPPAASALGPKAEPSSPQKDGNGGFTVSTGTVSAEELRRKQQKTDYYLETLSLSDCELTEKKEITDKYTYTVGSVAGVVQIREDMVFDEEGFYRSGWDACAEGTFLSVVYRDDSGSLWGELYRVPDDLLFHG